MEKKRHPILYSIILTAAFALLLGGCMANGKVSTGKIADGEKAVAAAKEGNASANAPAELQAAEGKLAQAKEAFAKKDYPTAGALADQAAVDAEYAQTKATTEKNKKAAAEMQKNIDALRQEVERLSKQ